MPVLRLCRADSSHCEVSGGGVSSVSSYHSASHQTSRSLGYGGANEEDGPPRHPGALKSGVPAGRADGIGGGDGPPAEDEADPGQAAQAGEQGGRAPLAGPGRDRHRERRVRSVQQMLNLV